MVSINYATREVTCKIVYYGPGLSGKTTNLLYIHEKVPSDTKGKMISLATEADRTLYFDFLPINIGTISGFAAKFQLYTVPGQVYYNATRKLVLRGADGLVFVADSQADKMDENIESLNNMKENLEEYGYDINDMPICIQYNKRDLPGALPVDELEAKLNPYGWKSFEGVATDGGGVFDTLKMIIKLVLDKARKSQSSSKPAPAPTKPASPVPERTAAPAVEAPLGFTTTSQDTTSGAARPAPAMVGGFGGGHDGSAQKPAPDSVNGQRIEANDRDEYEDNGDTNREIYATPDQSIYDKSVLKDDHQQAPEIVGNEYQSEIKQPIEQSGQTIQKEEEAWGSERPFPGSTGKIARRDGRITVSDFQSGGQAGDSVNGEENVTNTNRETELNRPMMAPSERVKKKKRGFFKRMFGIK